MGYVQAIATSPSVTGQFELPLPTPSPVDAFSASLAYRPFFAYWKTGRAIVDSRRNAARYPYIQPNPPHAVQWLVFDMDVQGGALAWMDANLPPPNFSVETAVQGKKTTAHLFYGLKDPVLKASNGRLMPVVFMEVVYKAMAGKLGADPGFVGPNVARVKNPLYRPECSPLDPENKEDPWRVTVWRNDLYTLKDLQESMDELSPAGDNAVRADGFREDFADAGRNCHLFENLRFWAYRQKRSGSYFSYDAFLTSCFAQAHAIATEEPDFRLNEIEATARSVAKWTWERYQGDSGDGKDRGVMGLMSSGLSLKVRQAKGGAYAAGKRQEHTIKALLTAYNWLMEGKTDPFSPPRQRDVALIAGRCLRTAQIHWRSIRNEYLLDLMKRSKERLRKIEETGRQQESSPFCESQCQSVIRRRLAPERDVQPIVETSEVTETRINKLLKDRYRLMQGNEDKGERN